MKLSMKQAALIYNEMVAPKTLGATSEDAVVEETGASMAAQLFDAPVYVATADTILALNDKSNSNVMRRFQAVAYLRKLADALEGPGDGD